VTRLRPSCPRGAAGARGTRKPCRPRARAPRQSPVRRPSLNEGQASCRLGWGEPRQRKRIWTAEDRCQRPPFAEDQFAQDKPGSRAACCRPIGRHRSPMAGPVSSAGGCPGAGGRGRSKPPPWSSSRNIMATRAAAFPFATRLAHTRAKVGTALTRRARGPQRSHRRGEVRFPGRDHRPPHRRRQSFCRGPRAARNPLTSSATVHSTITQLHRRKLNRDPRPPADGPCHPAELDQA